VAYQELRGKETGATAAEMRERVLTARAIQTARGSINATEPAGRLRDICPLDAAAEKTLEIAVRRLALSARAHDRILKVSRTIAEVGGSEQDQSQTIGPNTLPRPYNTPRSTGSIGNRGLSLRTARLRPPTQPDIRQRARHRIRPGARLCWESLPPGISAPNWRWMLHSVKCNRTRGASRRAVCGGECPTPRPPGRTRLRS
jgi:hypothetical protein